MDDLAGQSSLSAGLRSLLHALGEAPERSLPVETLGAGDRIGRYELRREIGRGGFGVVFEAFDAALSRLVAVKLTRTARGGPELFRREAQATAQLHHPNVVVVHDFGALEGVPFLVMELLQGENLHERLAREPMAPRQALAVVSAAARGVAHAHRAGLVHRDLKPSNVFLTADGQVKVLDFGLAHTVTEATEGGGTPAFMAPEQRLGLATDRRTDVWGLGRVLREALGGGAPPSGFKPVLARALEEDPARRYPDAEALLAALEAAAASRAARARWTALVAVALALGLLAGGAALWVRASRRPRATVSSRKLVVTSSSCASNPSFSADGSTLFYDGQMAEGDWQLFARDLQAGVERRLTHGPGDDYAAVASPDGQRVAYVHLDTKGREIRVVPSGRGDAASPPTTVARSPLPSRPAWLADGRLVFADQEGNGVLAWDLSQSPPRSTLFARLPAGATLFRSSALADGGLIGVWRQDNAHAWFDLGELREDKPHRVLAVRQELPTGLAVGPAQDGFYYGSFKAPLVDLGWFPLAGGPPAPTPSELAPQAGIAFSADGRRAAFSTCSQSGVLARLRPGQPSSHLSRAANLDCCFRSLGKDALLFLSRGTGDTGLWSLHLKTGERRLLTGPGATSGAASPDGQQLVYMDNQRPGLWTVPLAGGAPRQLTAVRDESSPAFSFDGRNVVFVRAGEKGLQAMVVPVDGGPASSLYAMPVVMAAPVPTDSRVLLLVRGESGVELLIGDLAGTPPRRLSQLPSGYYVSVRPSSDGKRALLSTAERVLEVALDGSAPATTVWKGKGEGVGLVDYAPDGDGYIAELVAFAGDLWLAEGTFR